MKDHTTPLLPACEEGYQKLQKLLYEHRESTTKRINLEALDKLVAVFLDDMQKTDTSVTSQAKHLFTSAGIDNSVYDHNFRTVNGLVLLLKGVLVDGIDNYVVGRFGVFSYETALTRLFEYLAVPSADTYYNSVRLRFALLRFPDEFWEIALHSLYSFVVKNWTGFDFDTQELLYARYVASFRIVLKYWMKHDFSSDYVSRCFQLLNKLTGLSVQDAKALQSCIADL